MNIIKKTVCDNKKNWDGKIKSALWVDTITTKKATSKTPFELGTKVKLPISLKILVYHLMQHFTTNQEVVQARIDQLVELEKSTQIAFDQMIKKLRNYQRNI
jgi:hypothetical protein